MDDLALLREYAAKKSEAAFESLVSRYINVVYSAALRQAGTPDMAEEITQAVFIILARKAGSMDKGTFLLGWLVRTVCFTASAQIRTAARRQRREQEAYMESSNAETSPDPAWDRMSPLLDEALASLSAPDRQAVLLRFLEQKSLAEVGASLAVKEEAARKRVTRALEKLRQFFIKRGVVLTTAVIGGAMSAHAVQAAPAGLAAAVTGTAFAHTAAGVSTLTLVKGALKIMAWTKAKMALVAGVGVLLAAGTTTVVVKELRPSDVDEKWFELSGTVLGNAPANLAVIRPTHFAKQGSGMGGKPERIVCQNEPLEWGLVFGDNFSSSSPTRLVLPKDFPMDHFDYLITLPQNRNDSGQDGVRRVMRDLIKSKFGFVAHRETRERDVFLLEIKNPNAPGLQKTVQDPFEGTAITSSVEGLSSQNIPMYALAADLEDLLAVPVLDRTGLTNRFAINLRWDKLPGETTTDTIRRVVLNQLGFEFVPSHQPVEMLVVEQVKN
jgi:uncharacterized protein (TIGR03435 family)